jgi:mannose-6-phosphate isomerase-like protein (cupin superfamily)
MGGLREEAMKNRSNEILGDPSLRDPDGPATAAGSEFLTEETVHRWSLTHMLERAEALRRIARYGHGSATESVTKYPGHSTMLTFRGHDGVAELHDEFADLYFVLDGRAILVTGGELVGGLPIDEGEYRGLTIENGTQQELRTGDVVHVPAGVPHQILVGGNRTITCFVVRIKESE